MITQGMAQQTGRQTGTTALPELSFDFILLLASYSYFDFALYFPPPLWNNQIICLSMTDIRIPFVANWVHTLRVKNSNVRIFNLSKTTINCQSLFNQNNIFIFQSYFVLPRR